MSDPNSSSAPQTGATPSPAGPLPVRKLTQPYFDVRPNSQFTYFVPEYLRVVKSDAEPLARFLADARLEPGSRPDQRRIEYSLGAIPADQIRPLEFLAKAEVEAFEVAARQFYVAAHQDQRVPMAEKEARKSFRLPDPDKEPDAYWVYGHQYDPKLLILWGAEKERNSALPLVEDPEVVPRNAITLAQKLRKRLLPWEKKKKQVIEMIKARNEPLARFIEVGEPIFDKKTQKLTGIKTPDGQTRPVKDWRRLNRNLNAAEVKAFEAAAKTFYDRAHPAGTEGAPDEGEVTPYERELRQDFRLPDPDSHPDAYWVYGSAMSSKLMVLCRCTEQQGECLPLVVDEVLKLPEDTGSAAPAAGSAAFADANKGEQLAGLAGKTVAGKLAKHKKSPMATVIRAGVSAAIVLIALALWQFVINTPPTFKASATDDAVRDPENKRDVILVTFDKAINASTLAKAEGQKGLSEQWDLKAGQGTAPIVLNAAFDKDSKKALVLHTSAPLQEDVTYILFAKGIKSSLGKPVNPSTKAEFKYVDEREPDVVKAYSAPDSDSKVVVEFTERVDKATAEQPANYVLEEESTKAKVEVRAAFLDAKSTSVTLQAGGALKSKQKYLITPQNVKDMSKKGNVIKPKAFPFVFTAPAPLIKAVAANRTLTEVLVTFDRALDEATAKVIDNYQANNDLKITAASLKPGDPTTVVLTTSKMARSTEYLLKVQNLKSARDAVMEKPDEKTFTFSPTDTVGPAILDGKLDGRVLTLTFDKGIAEASAKKPDAFKVSYRARRDQDYTPVDVQFAVGLQGNTVTLTFGADLTVGQFKVVAAGLEDDIGNAKTSEYEGTKPGSSYEVKVINLRLVEGKKIVLTFNQLLVQNSVQKTKFKVDGAQVADVMHEKLTAGSGAKSVVTLVLDKAVPADTAVSGTFQDLRAEGVILTYGGKFGMAR